METQNEEKKPEKEAPEKRKGLWTSILSELFIDGGILGFIQFMKEAHDTWLPSEKEYIRLKAKLEEYERGKITDIVWTICFIGILILCLFLATQVEEKSSFYINIFSFSLVTLIFVRMFRPMWIRQTRQRIREYELTYVQNEAQEDPFKNSIKTSYKYLDRYYDQTQQQAKSGFRITSLVALFGAGLISVGVLLLYFGDNEKITPAYITCASGVITEFISSIFFAMYNKTITSMNSYHDKLVLSQNIAFALRVAGEIDGMGEKNKAKLAIINELVKDVNAQMMKSDGDADEQPKKDKPSADEPPS